MLTYCAIGDVDSASWACVNLQLFNVRLASGFTNKIIIKLWKHITVKQKRNQIMQSNNTSLIS